MAKQTINIGTSANDGTGSTLREAFDITNDNFTELYDGTGGLLYKLEGTNFTDSLLIGHNTTGTLDNALGNTGVGIAALNALTSGDYNVAVGNEAGGAITSGERNVLMGYAAGDAITISSYNTAVGHGALSAEDTRHGSTAVGYKALNLQNATADPYNTAIGYHAAFLLTTGLENTVIGGKALDALTTGHLNVAVGYESLSTEDTGSRNTAVGWGALKDLNYDGLGYNAAFGMSAGENISTGIQNTLIGSLAADSLTTGSNNIVLGYNAEASAVDVSNEVTIGDTNISTVRIPSDSTLKIGASGDLQLEHVSSNSFIKNTAVGDLYIENQVDDANIIFRCDDGSGGLDTYFSVVGAGNRVQYNKNLRLIDTVQLSLGSSDDLKIYHNATDSIILNETGDLYIANGTDDKDIIFQSDDGSGGLATYITLDGSQGFTTAQKTIRFDDGAAAQFGGAADLRINHNGTDSFITNHVGDLKIIQNTDDGDISFQSDDGSGGTTTYFFLDGSKVNGSSITGATVFPDKSKIYIGTSGDLEIFHNGSQTYIENYTGEFNITQHANDQDIIFKCDDGSGGVTEYFSLDGGNVRLNAKVDLRIYDAKKLQLGNSGDLQIYHNNSNDRGYIYNTTGDLYIENDATDGDIKFFSDDGSGGTTEYFRLDGGDGINYFFKDIKFLDDGRIKFGTSSDLQIYHNGTNSLIENSTGDFYISNKQDDGDIIFFCDDGSGGTTEYFKLDGSSKRLDIADSIPLCFGAGDDLQIQHNGSTSYIQNFTGNLIIENNLDDGDIIFKSDDGSGGTTTYFQLDGSHSKMIAYKDIHFEDNVKARFGNYANADLEIYHNASDSVIENNVGDLYITNKQDDGDIIFRTDNGSGAFTEYFKLDGGSTLNVFYKPVFLGDGVKSLYGNSSDLQIYHNGSHSYIDETGSGSLFVRADDSIEFKSYSADEFLARFISNDRIELYFNGSKKLETTNTGATVTGTLIAATGDLETSGVGYGLILKSPNGTRYRVTVDNSGNLSTTAV